MQLKVKKLSYHYSAEAVLRELCLSLETGSFVALLGENGTGKSTLIRCLAGLLPVPPGVIFYDQKDIAAISLEERARLIAYVPQSPQFEENEVVYDFLLHGRKPWFTWRAPKKDEERVFLILQEFGIEELALRSMATLSGGERQKVAIARAFLQDTPVILLDEPANNLDVRFQLEVMDRLSSKAQTEGRLIITALHDVNLALRYCDQAVLLSEGSIVSAGKGSEAITRDSLEKIYKISCALTDVGPVKVFLPGHPSVAHEYR